MSGTTPRTAGRPVGMAELLAAARAARAVSTPPQAPQGKSAEPASGKDHGSAATGQAPDLASDQASDEPPRTAAAA